LDSSFFYPKDLPIKGMELWHAEVAYKLSVDLANRFPICAKFPELVENVQRKLLSNRGQALVPSLSFYLRVRYGRSSR